MVSFAEPRWLWVLAAIGAAIPLVYARHHGRLNRQRRLASPAVWDRLLGGAPATGLWRILLWCAAAALIVLALARPQWGELPEEVSVRTRDLVVALDVSDSMLCPDVRPNRLARSLEIIRRALPGLAGNRIGIVVFSGEAYSLIPLTTDLEAAASFLDGVRPGMVGKPGSNIEAAVEAAVRLLPGEGEGRVVVLFSDGENLQGNLDRAATTLVDAGVGFIGVVVGTERGGPIPVVDASGAVHYKKTKEGRPVVTRAQSDGFEKIAEAVGGEVLKADGSQPEKQLVATVEALRTREVQTEQKPRKIERFPLFLMAAAVLLAVSFLLSPWRRRAAVAMLVIGLGTVSAGAQSPPPAPRVPQAVPSGAAAEPEATAPQVPWWQRWIPGGSRRMARSGLGRWRKGDVAGAVERFAGAAELAPENPERIYDLGTALAGAGQAETAVPLLSTAGEQGVAGAFFNAGTAALEAGQAEPAVENLRKALLRAGDDPDVKRNFELALKLLEEQQQQQQDDQQKNDQDQQKDQKDQKDQQQDGNGPKPTPTPQPQGNQGPQPTPTPNPDAGLFDALDRAEAQAREAMQTPVPQSSKVEKDW